MSRRLTFMLVSILLPLAVMRSATTPADVQAADSSGETLSDWIWLASGDASPAPAVASMATSLSRPKTAEITVTYADFPEAPQAAWEYAVAILERQVTTPTEILISASWQPLGEDVLAAVRFPWFAKDPVEDPNLPQPNVLYAGALAGAYRGHRLDARPDMEIVVNSDIDWYTPTDGMPHPDTVDLVTVALHEMFQGLGFASALNPFATSPLVLPSVYDLFVVGPDGTFLYQQDLTTMRESATSNEVSFVGPAARVAAGGVAPQLSAPPFWSPGSSLSHLSLYYTNADPDHLLGPVLVDGWAFHDPGPITLAVLKDIGWTVSALGTATRVTITNQEPGLVATGQPFPVPISVAIQDPVGARVTGDNSTRVTLEAWGGWDQGASWSCPGYPQPVLTVSAGAATFSGCMATGPWSRMYFRATAPGLAPGMLHYFRLASDVATAYAPAVARTR